MPAMIKTFLGCFKSLPCTYSFSFINVLFLFNICRIIILCKFMYKGPFIIYSSGAGIKSLLTFHNDQSIWIGIPIKLNLTLYFINTLLKCNPLSIIFCLLLEKIYLVSRIFPNFEKYEIYFTKLYFFQNHP